MDPKSKFHRNTLYLDRFLTRGKIPVSAITNTWEYIGSNRQRKALGNCNDEENAVEPVGLASNDA